MFNCCKLHIIFTNKTRIGINFHFKELIPEDLTLCAVYKFLRGLFSQSYFSEWVKNLNVRIGEHICISQLTKKKFKTKNSSLGDHLLFCNHSVHKVFTRTEREAVDNERSTLFGQENYIGSIVPIRRALVIRSLIEFYLFLIVATLLLSNELFIFLPSKTL